MGFSYQFGGMKIASQEPIPGLHPLVGGGCQLPVLEIALERRAPPKGDRQLYLWAGSYGLSLWSCGEDWLFQTPAIGSVLVERTGERVTGFPHPDASAPAFAELLAARVLPRVAVLRGALGLHAAAVSRQRQALLLLGVSGAGKSTLSNALARQLNWRLLTDDAAVIDSRTLMTWPTARGSALWPDSRDALRIEDQSDATEPRRSGKLRIDNSAPSLAEPSAVRGVIFLNRSQAFDQPRLNRLSGFEVMAGAAHQIVRFHPGDPGTAPGLVARLADLANGAPGYRLDYPSDYAAIPAVGELLQTCLERALAA